MVKKLLNKLRTRFLENKIDESISILKSSHRSPTKPIKSIGCIVDTNLDLDYSDILDLAVEMGLKEKDIKIISYSNSIYNDPFCKMRISDKSVNFYGNIISADAEEFTSSKYDILINYFGENRILTLLSSKTNAKFRVGFESVDSRLNDLIFSQKIKKYNDFKNEIIKYLKMIK